MPRKLKQEPKSRMREICTYGSMRGRRADALLLLYLDPIIIIFLIVVFYMPPKFYSADPLV